MEGRMVGTKQEELCLRAFWWRENDSGKRQYAYACLE